MKKFLVNQYHTHRYILSAPASSDVQAGDRHHLSSYLFLLASGILFFAYFSLLVSTVGFFLNIPITSYHIAVSSGLAATILYLLARHVDRNISILVILSLLGVVALTIVLSGWFTGKFYDLSYDGQTYHQETIIALGYDWNPVYRELTQDSYSGISYRKLLNSYPKASEIMETVLHKSIGRMESAKGLNILFAVMAWAFSFSFLNRLRKLPFPVSLVISLCIVVTPVTITQSLSFYLDSQLYFLLVSQLAILGTFFLTGRNYCLFPILACLPILWNMKVTAIITSSIFSAGFLLFSWYNGKILIFFKTLQIHVVASAVAFIVIGFHPYVTNTLRYGHPFYPAAGRRAADYITINMPSSFYSKSPVERLFLSAFSRSLPVRGIGKSHTLKLPFTLTDREVESFTGNLTVGGFGPLFGGILLLSLTALPVVFLGQRKCKANRTFLLFVIGIIVSCAVIPVSSYARFVPQMWLIPCIALGFLFLNPSFLPRTLGFILLFTMGFNLFFIAFRYYSWNITASEKIESELSGLRVLSASGPLRVDFGDFRSNRVRFAEAGIAYSESPATDCVSGLRRLLADTITESPIRMCR